ncbi:prepilin-type N-terminal cleavage/methylation domain-containing protein [Salibacterium salarium]|uniref:PulJ/GspJ family protein n=1 Tax=Salibacterium salarium TaxID=284579 RepID=UPI002786D219|nr:prepilin-type N-terminal cleavage/methylation domain-containing protein [Salibacterium salarium]MDQ0300213.1 prepilin-type N-terminal cleavage/methylation domain-containing protein [Salibacterium salarium]
MKLFLQKESGVTLIELLLTLVISSIVIGIVTNVIVSSINFNEKTQSHVDLRQEANIIITELRQQHQVEEDYSICPEELVSGDRFHAEQLSIQNNEQMITNCEDTINPQYPLEVQFTLGDNENNEFTIDTIIEGEREGDINVTINPPEIGDDYPDYIIEENLFLYGGEYKFQGTNLNGPNATMVVKGPLDMREFNGGSNTNVSNIYVDGLLDFEGGGQNLGSKNNPGEIHVNGDFDTGGGSHHIYGDVYVAEDFNLEGANIHGNVYVDGDVTLSDYYSMDEDANIYYTGSLSYPDYFDEADIDSIFKEDSVAEAKIPEHEIPSSKSNGWYEENGYTEEIQEDGMRLYDDDVLIEDNINGRYQDTFTDSVVVSEGDITISGGNLSMTGVLFAPNGKVTFKGASFDGTVIAEEGFNVESGGTDVNFVSVEEYINNKEDYPF